MYDMPSDYGTGLILKTFHRPNPAELKNKITPECLIVEPVNHWSSGGTDSDSAFAFRYGMLL